MNPGPLLTSILLFLGNAFFVAAEYGLLSAKRIKIQTLADKKNQTAALVIKAMDARNRYVASIQIGITLFSIAIGAVTEPALSEALRGILPSLPKTLLSVLSILVVSYPLVVLGELVPKYVSIRNPEAVILASIRPLLIWSALVQPMIWLFQTSGSLFLKLFGIDINKAQSEQLSREELQVILQAGETEGQFDEQHADVILRALRLDKLKTGSVMVHRLDMQSLSIDVTHDDLIKKLESISHSRLPVYGSDLDDIRGVVYLQDLVKGWRTAELNLENYLKPAEFVPENLSLDRALRIMRTRHTQILIVQDEWGGTSGMLTLEDIVEEVLGDLEDRLESDRPDIERVTDERLKLTPYVRWDQVMDFLDLPLTEDVSTTTVTQILHERLEKLPNQGDYIQTELGRLVVDQTTRRRITQISLYLKPEYRHRG